MSSRFLRLTLGVFLIVVLAACGQPFKPSVAMMNEDQFQNMLLDMTNTLGSDSAVVGLPVLTGFWGDVLLSSNLDLLSSDLGRDVVSILTPSEFPYGGPVLAPVFGVAPLMVVEEEGDPVLATGTYLYPVSGTDTYTPNEATESFLRSTTEVEAGQLVDAGEVTATLTYDETRNLTFPVVGEDVTVDAPVTMSFEVVEDVITGNDVTRIAATVRQNWVTNTCDFNEIDAVTIEDVTIDLSTPVITLSDSDDVPEVATTFTMPQAGITFGDTGIELDGNANFSIEVDGFEPFNISSSGEVTIPGSIDRSSDCYPTWLDMNSGSGNITLDVNGVTIEVSATITVTRDGSVIVTDGRVAHEGRFVIVSGVITPDDEIIEEVLNVTFVNGETKTLAEAISAIDVLDVTLNRLNLR